ncbi:non-hydrolyzing UDP-N-acetylglucosamine 2-epimerase [Rhodopseudomonas sp.]|uniref:non-hydrolyzing UDP-N-acetylglucosamine 2-epimerase n=1 Tax=Rhodopseudomonas sp. TaxID=1078 RepID=UPI003B3A7E0F
MRVLLAFGSRPEIIKLAPVYQALDRRPDVQTDAVWTGQHVELAAGLLDLFDIQLTVDGGLDSLRQPELTDKFGEIVRLIGDQLRRGRYDWLVVQGDTTTAVAASIAGFLCKVPVAHVEAGLRTNDLQSPWPEEFNRRLVSVATSVHFAPTPRAEVNLIREGIPPASIHVVGNTVVDALLYTRRRVAGDYQPIDRAISNLPPGKLVLATTHRRENIGEPMIRVLQALRTLGKDGDKVIVLPAHLNPDVRQTVDEILGEAPNVRVLAPLQYQDFVHLLSRAWCVVSDSGGIQEEAPSFGLQILITRETTERPEVLHSGFGRLVGSDAGSIVRGVRALTASPSPQLLSRPNPFGTGDAGERIAAVLAGEADQMLQAAE